MKAKTLLYSMLVLASVTLGLVHADTNCIPLPSGVIAWWPGDGVALDIAGTNHGTLQNGAAYRSGEAGQSFSIANSSSYLQVPDNHAWAFGTNEFTIELWANFASASGNLVFIANDTAPGYANKWRTLRADGRNMKARFISGIVADGAIRLVAASATGNAKRLYREKLSL